MTLSRRQLIKQFGVSAAAGTIFSPKAFAIAGQFRETDTAESLTMAPALVETLAHIADHVIPRTDTPGARDVLCHHFVVHQLQHVYDKADYNKVEDLLTFLLEVGKDTSSFPQISYDTQRKILVDLEQAASPFSDIHRDTFRLVKSLIVFGYYTSEPGATKELKYLAVPGGFKGSVPLDSVGSAFSSKAYY
ncbi:gluconate 2-dehydrogenase subunit 3 family protein [Aestuariibacter sp. A3R04]|uniref:gluconate 2-dehydrogenase subunit 3 family protein n=1 Tax=Aestuariibacter sp. A3R04 TaxID=2841571 RepID=UPI001C0A5339|nr:gluconate 2-dehydrogenase subunit 3 family protein [Aestuariibacter sp. A3R04]MBU3023249.1 gluconate 2-dehydrogenase subunit 3 family protein [Aestuariibacter sp. A3R04]